MPWREVTRKAFDCDGCGQVLTDPEFGQEVTFPLDATLREYDVTEDAGWFHEGSKTYCPACWHWCEGLGWYPRLGKEVDCLDPECIEARAERTR